MLKGFRDFISRGNPIDMAVGIIIGTAFTPIISAITDKVLMPLIGAIFGKPNFDTVGQFHLNGAVIQPGTIVTAVINFLLIAAALYFCIVAPMNKMAARKAAEVADGAKDEAEVSEEVQLLSDIRDLLRKDSAV